MLPDPPTNDLRQRYLAKRTLRVLDTIPQTQISQRQQYPLLDEGIVHERDSFRRGVRVDVDARADAVGHVVEGDGRVLCVVAVGACVVAGGVAWYQGGFMVGR